MATMRYVVADESHDAALCTLMRSVSMPGAIELIYSRDPSFYAGLTVQGDFHEIGIVPDPDSDGYVGMGVRSLRPMYINGQAREFGYLHSLRAARKRRGGITREIFVALREHHQDHRVKGYINTIIENNFFAMQALLTGRDGMANYIDGGTFTTYAVNINRRRSALPTLPGLTIDRAVPGDLDAIVAFLNREGARRQYYPAWRRDDFDSPVTRDFRMEDMYLARRGNEIVGTIGKWDQTAYKQHIVTAYHGAMKHLRPLLNAGLSLAGYKALPDPGRRLEMFYASFVCVKDDEVPVLRALIDRLYQDNRDGRYHFFMIGFHERDGLAAAVKPWYAITYPSRLFMVSWDEDVEWCRGIRQDMVPYLETGVL